MAHTFTNLKKINQHSHFQALINESGGCASFKLTHPPPLAYAHECPIITIEMDSITSLRNMFLAQYRYHRSYNQLLLDCR
jgi:hypothetical protein